MDANPPEWIQNYPDDIQQHLTLHKFKTPEDALLGYVNLEERLGNHLRIPGADAGIDAHTEFTTEVMEKYNANSPFELVIKPDATNDEAMALWNQQTGVPTEADSYQAEVEGSDQLEQQTMQRTRELSLASNLTQDQHKRFVEWMVKEQTELTQAVEGAKEDNRKTIVDRFGPSADQRLARIASVAKAKGTDLDTSDMHADLVFLLDSMVDDLKGKGPQGFDMPGTEIGPTHTELKSRITERRNRLIKEPNMPRDEYNRLQEANIRDMQSLADAR